MINLNTLIPIILSSLITFVITNRIMMRSYRKTIKYKNGLIDKLAKENGTLRK